MTLLYLPIFTSFGRRWSCYSYLKGHFYNYKSTFTLTDKCWSCYSYLEGYFIFSSILIMIWKRSWEIFVHPLFLIWFLMRAAISFSHLKFKSEVISYDYSPLNKRQNIFCIFKDMSTVFVLSVLDASCWTSMIDRINKYCVCFTSVRWLDWLSIIYRSCIQECLIVTTMELLIFKSLHLCGNTYLIGRPHSEVMTRITQDQ